MALHTSMQKNDMQLSIPLRHNNMHYFNFLKKLRLSCSISIPKIQEINRRVYCQQNWKDKLQVLKLIDHQLASVWSHKTLVDNQFPRVRSKIVKLYSTGYWLIPFYLSIASHKMMANNKKGDSFSLDFWIPTSKLNASDTMAVQYFSHSHPRSHTTIITFKHCIFMLNKYSFFSFLVWHHNWIQYSTIPFCSFKKICKAHLCSFVVQTVARKYIWVVQDMSNLESNFAKEMLNWK